MDKRRILVVDDEPGFTRMVKLNLERTGLFAVREEQEPRRVLAAAHEFHPHLILLDVVLPGMPGGEVLREIRADATFQGIPVLMVTALICREDAPGGMLRQGNEVYVPKPVDTRTLIGLITSCLAKPETNVMVGSASPTAGPELLTADPA